jgi:hypothetical protein
MKRLPLGIKQKAFTAMGYTPSPAQLAIHDSENRFDFVSGGWRSGKSFVMSRELVPHCLVPMPKPYTILLIGPTYKEPRVEFEYMVGCLSQIGVLSRKDVSMPKEGACEFTIPMRKTNEGNVYFAKVMTMTAAEAEAIRAVDAEAVGMCEAGGMAEASFYAILGRVLSTGGFVFGSGTLEISQKWYHRLVQRGLYPNPEGIRSHILPSWANIFEFPGGREDPKIKQMEALLPNDVFDIRVAAMPVKMTGLVVRELDTKNISDKYEFDPSLMVELAIDPGYAGAYAVLAIQNYNGEIRIIDEVYKQLMTTDDVIEICKEKPWWKNVVSGVIDRAAKQHQAAESVLEMWHDRADLWLDLTEGTIKVADLTEQLRIHAKTGHLKVNPNCRGLLGEWDLASFPDGLEHLSPWRYKEGVEGTNISDRSVTGSDHASTALGYYLVNRFGYVGQDALDYGFEEYEPVAQEYGATESKWVAV